MQAEELPTRLPVDPVEARQIAAFVLGLPTDADDRTALRAFRQAARRHHPHHGGNPTVYNTMLAAWAAWNHAGGVVLTDDDLEASVELADELPEGTDNRTPVADGERVRQLPVAADGDPVARVARVATQRRDRIVEELVGPVADELVLHAEEQDALDDIEVVIDVEALPVEHRAYATAGTHTTAAPAPRVVRYA